MLEEFRKFAMRGSVVDLAVGVIIGAAFTSIVNSLVKDILTPPIGYLTGGIDFANFFFVLKGGGTYTTLADAQKAGAITVNYGVFLNTVISFLIVAFILFLIMRQLNRFLARQEPPPPGPSQEVVLLGEIRDLLKARG
jgi:large conductance mechanosensitive channel